MPIEDVQYLLNHSVKDSVLLFVDSTHRDRKKYATPSEYIVDLDEPISQVFGIDILDASIPSTMYNVDRNNNRLRVISVQVSASDASLSTAGLETADEVEVSHLASLNASMNALGLASPLRSVWLPDTLDASFRVVIGTWSSGVSSLLDALVPVNTNIDASASVTSQQRFRLLRERRHGPLVMWRTSSGGAGGITVPSDVTAFPLRSNGQNYVLKVEGSESIAAVDSVRALSARDVLLQAYAVIPRGEIVEGGGGSELYDLVIYDMYALDDQASLDRCSSELSLSGGGRALSFSIDTVEMQTGNYGSVKDLQTVLQDAFSAKGLAVTVANSAPKVNGLDVRGTLRFVTDSDLRIIIATAFSSARTTLGLDLDTDSSVNAAPRGLRQHGAVVLGGQAAPMYASVLQEDGTQLLDSPGIVSLAGTRYITLRCPQIEQHMSANSRLGRHSAGIGVFKLLNSNEIAHLRFDYVSLVRKPFHPIARVSRLHFRFELSDGTLYDFKGVNHQIMLTIKYYVPMPSADATAPGDGPRSILNPNYTANFIDFMSNRDDPFGFLDDDDESSYESEEEDLRGNRASPF